MWSVCLLFKLRASQKIGGHLKVNFVPYMVKMDWFLSFFAQSQKKRGVPLLCHHQFHPLSFCLFFQLFFSSKCTWFCSILSFLSIFSNCWLHMAIVVLFTFAHACILDSIYWIKFWTCGQFIKKLLLVLWIFIVNILYISCQPTDKHFFTLRRLCLNILLLSIS